jgi:hypothetical protein
MTRGMTSRRATSSMIKESPAVAIQPDLGGSVRDIASEKWCATMVVRWDGRNGCEDAACSKAGPRFVALLFQLACRSCSLLCSGCNAWEVLSTSLALSLFICRTSYKSLSNTLLLLKYPQSLNDNSICKLYFLRFDGINALLPLPLLLPLRVSVFTS